MMKIATILLLILALGLIVTGCSKKIPAAPTNNPSDAPLADTVSDITVDTATTNPDIGTLDNISVSDEIPQ